MTGGAWGIAPRPPQRPAKTILIPGESVNCVKIQRPLGASSSPASSTPSDARGVPVVAVGDYLVAVLDEVERAESSDGSVTVRRDAGVEQRAGILARDEVLGIAVLAAQELLATGLGADASVGLAAGWHAPGPVETGTRVSLVGQDGSVTEAVVGVASGARAGVYPLEIAVPAGGARLVRDSEGRAVGVAVRHHHASWFVSYDAVSALIAAARAATN